MFRRLTNPPTGKRPPAARPGPRGSLGRRFAFVFMPLALIPSLIIGLAGYFQSRAILERQAVDQLNFTAETQATALLEWGRAREQLLQLGSQRSSLLQPISVLLEANEGPRAQPARENARLELERMETQEGQVRFSDVMILDTETGEILVATRPAWEGSRFEPAAQGLLPNNRTQTQALVDETSLSMTGLTVVTSAPLRTPGAAQVNALLVGVNFGVRLGALMEEMQVFQQQRGVFRVERGTTYLTVAPDLLVSLPRYSIEPRAVPASELPIFGWTPDAPSAAQTYESLDGIPVIGAYEWLPGWGMGVLVEMPQAVVFGELDSLIPFVIITLLASIVITMSVVAFATRRTLRPLERLADFAGRIALGEWMYRVPEERNDELGALAIALNKMAQDLSDLYHSLEAQVQARTKQIQTAAQVAHDVTTAPTLDDLLQRAVNLIRDQFGYYHVSIFLIDRATQRAELREATGEIGQVLKARRHSLEVGSNSVIGWVTANNQPRVASDVMEDPVHFKNELLPDTRAEAAVPLQVGGEVLGALDVQSTEPEAFQPEDVEILQTLADQLSVALQNARLAETSMNAAERARLVSEATTQFSGLLEVDQVLYAAASSIQRALGRPDVIVKLASGNSEAGPPSENGGAGDEGTTRGDGDVNPLDWLEASE